jgi:hypothetical protein
VQGARLLLGGGRVDRPGLYMEPTIFCDVEESHILFMTFFFCFSATPKKIDRKNK